MWVMASLVVVVVWAGLSLEPLLGDGILYSRDLGRWQAPLLRTAWAESAAEGVAVPFWSHGVGFGRPVLGDAAFAILHPLSLLYRLLPFERAFNLFILVQLLLAGLCMLRLGRVLGLGWGGSVISGVAYMMAGFTLSCTYQYPMIGGVALAPLVLAQGLVAVSRPRVWRIAVLAIVVAVQLFSGQPEPVLLAVGAGVLLSSMGGVGRRGFSLAANIAVWGGGLFWGLLIAAPQLLPAWRFAGLTIRSFGFTARGALYWSLHPQRIPSILWPTGSKNPLDHVPLDGSSGLIDGGVALFSSLYSGFSVAVLAVICLVLALYQTIYRGEPGSRRIDRRMIGGIALAATFGLVLAMGRFLPGVETAAEIVGRGIPFRFPVKMLLLTSLAVPLLAGCGHDLLGNFVVPRWRRSFTMVIFAVVVADLGLAHRDMLPVAPKADSFAGSSLARLLQVEAERRGHAGAQWRLYHHRTPTGIRGPWLREDDGASSRELFGAQSAMLMPDTGVPLDISYGFENAVNLLEPVAAFNLARAVHQSAMPIFVRGLAEAGVLWVISPFEDLEEVSQRRLLRIGEIARMAPVAEGSGWLYLVAQPLPRLRLATEYVVSERADAAAAVARYEKQTWPPAILVNRAPSFASVPQPDDPGSVEVVYEGSRELRVVVDAGQRCLLVVSDLVLPGWSVSVDDRPRDLVTSNGVFRAVEVPAGLSRVRFDYHPPGWQAGIMVGGVALLAAAAALVIGRRRTDPR